MKYALHICVQLCVHIILFAHGCLKNVLDQPVCEIVDIVQMMDKHAAPSYRCIPEFLNTIRLRQAGEISLECSAPYPIDLIYDSVMTASHFELSFYKKVETGKTTYDLENLNPTFHVTVLLHGTHTPWPANYIFYDMADKKKRTTISVFIERTFPLFLSDKSAEEDIIASYDATRESVILPCRVQNWNSTVTLFNPNFEQLTDGIDFPDDLQFDPRVGFTITWDPDKVVIGRYRCFTEMGDQNDELIVIVVSPEDYKDPEVVAATASNVNAHGTITLTKKNHHYVAQCKSPKKPNPKLFGLVNVRSNFPTTTRYTRGCLQPATTCENRKTGASTDTGLSEINPIFQSGVLKCLDKETLEYFIGADGNVYFDSADAKLKNALVHVDNAKKYEYYLPTETYELVCKISEYNCVKPIWWSIQYKNNTQHQFFEPVKTTTTLVMSNEVSGVSCGASLWNSTLWLTSHMPMEAARTSPPFIDSNNTHVSFELGSTNHLLQCKANGIPKPSLTWFRNGKAIDSSMTMQSEGDLDDLGLVFPQITRQDEGNYTCQASNLVGAVEMVFTVHVVVLETIKMPQPIQMTECKPGKNTTTTISTTRTITFFQFRPEHSDGQIIIPSKDKIRPGDELRLFLPNINSNSPELMSKGMNLTVRVINIGGNEQFPTPGTDEDRSIDLIGKLGITIAIMFTCFALVLIISCGAIYCYPAR